MKEQLLQGKHQLKKLVLRSLLMMIPLFCLLPGMQLTAGAGIPAAIISGKVTGDGNQPLVGVSVQVQGTTRGTTTNEQGMFSIEASPADVLIISYVGYGTQEVTVGNRTEINITLTTAGQELAQVVVIGYGAANKRDLTGTIATVKGKEVADKPATNPVASIQGKVAGVYIVNSGRPGSEPDVRIRGTNSINGVKPLYVVDGILNDNINFLNPADIESMEILKDPSSLAIFGVRGANGVIIITTKRAKNGQLLVNFNSSVGVKRVVDKVALTDAAQFKELYNEQLANDGIPPYDYTNWQGNTDWQDQIFQDAMLNYNNISISGGTEKNKFYMSAGYLTEEGIIKNEKLQKFTLTVNDEFQISKALKFGFNFNGYRAKPQVDRSATGALLAAPIAEPYNEEYGLYTILPSFQKAQVGNPLIDINLRNNLQRNFEYRAVGNIYGEVNFLKSFNFRAAFLADYGFNTGRGYSPLVGVYNAESANNANPYVDSLVTFTSVNQFQNIYTKIQADYLLTYKERFGDHNLTVLGGVTTYYNSFQGVSTTMRQYPNSPIPNDPNKWYTNSDIADPTTANANGSAWENATLSYLFRALYSFNRKYLLNASFRRDGSSAFYNTGKAYQNFGAVGAAWVISDENFMRNQKLFNNLKLKASWGVLGNQNVGEQYRYPAYPALSAASSGVFGNNVIQALTPVYLADPNLGWETVYAWETGLELNTLKNQLHFEANYYNKETKGILTTVPGINGTTPGLANIGNVTNKGFEFTASWNQAINDDLSYSISGNLTTIDNNVKSLSTTGYAIISGPSRTTAGYPIGYFFGYVSDGIYQTAEEIKLSPASRIGDVQPGDIKYKDVNGDGQIDEKDRTVIGNPTPDFTYGFSLNLDYKGISFSADFMGVYGNEIYRAWDQATYAQFNYPAYRLDRWNGVGTSNWEPILSTSRSINYLNSSYHIEDGSFFRIRNVQIGYNFSPALLKSIYVKSLRIYANAQNLKTFKNNSSFTPEFGGSATSFGVDNGSYPLPAIYTLGINLNF